jgi:hypothetical protein
MMSFLPGREMPGTKQPTLAAPEGANADENGQSWPEFSARLDDPGCPPAAVAGGW